VAKDVAKDVVMDVEEDEDETGEAVDEEEAAMDVEEAVETVETDEVVVAVVDAEEEVQRAEATTSLKASMSKTRMPSLPYRVSSCQEIVLRAGWMKCVKFLHVRRSFSFFAMMLYSQK
jgi:hypothetical protein